MGIFSTCVEKIKRYRFKRKNKEKLVNQPIDVLKGYLKSGIKKLTKEYEQTVATYKRGQDIFTGIGESLTNDHYFTPLLADYETITWGDVDNYVEGCLRKKYQDIKKERSELRIKHSINLQTNSNTKALSFLDGLFYKNLNAIDHLSDCLDEYKTKVTDYFYNTIDYFQSYRDKLTSKQGRKKVFKWAAAASLPIAAGIAAWQGLKPDTPEEQSIKPPLKQTKTEQTPAKTFDPNVIGYDNDTKTVLGLPENGYFEPKFSQEKPYHVHSPTEIRLPTEDEKEAYDLENKEYLIFSPDAQEHGEKYDFQAMGINIISKNEIIGQGYGRIKDENIFIPMSKELKKAFNNGQDTHFQAMGLRQVGDSDNYYITASYANGRLDPIEHSVVDTNKKINKYTELGRKIKKDLPSIARNRTKTPLIEKYISDRNIYSNIINDKTLNQWTNDFEKEISQATSCYKEAKRMGISNPDRLDYVIENAEMAAIETKTDASEALELARLLGDDITIGRWNSRVFDDQYVSNRIQQWYTATDTAGNKKYTTAQILSLVKEEFGHSMSESTMRKYL